MGEIEQKKRKGILAWNENLKAQIAKKEDIVFVDDGKACWKDDGGYELGKTYYYDPDMNAIGTNTEDENE